MLDLVNLIEKMRVRMGLVDNLVMELVSHTCHHTTPLYPNITTYLLSTGDNFANTAQTNSQTDTVQHNRHLSPATNRSNIPNIAPIITDNLNLFILYNFSYHVPKHFVFHLINVQNEMQNFFYQHPEHKYPQYS